MPRQRTSSLINEWGSSDNSNVCRRPTLPRSSERWLACACLRSLWHLLTIPRRSPHPKRSTGGKALTAARNAELFLSIYVCADRLLYLSHQPASRNHMHSSVKIHPFSIRPGRPLLTHRMLMLIDATAKSPQPPADLGPSSTPSASAVFKSFGCAQTAAPSLFLLNLLPAV